MDNKLLLLLTERTETEGIMVGENSVVSNFDVQQPQNRWVYGKTSTHTQNVYTIVKHHKT